jgi:hypothetical protein
LTGYAGGMWEAHGDPMGPYLVGALVPRQVTPAAPRVHEPLPLIPVVLVAAAEHHALRAARALPCDARHVREVGAPLAAVQAVGPELAHLHALDGRVGGEGQASCRGWGLG